MPAHRYRVVIEDVFGPRYASAVDEMTVGGRGSATESEPADGVASMTRSRVDRRAEHGEKLPPRDNRRGWTVPEGLSAAEVGKEIAEHKKHAAADEDKSDHDRWPSIIEAVLLSLVAVLAAYSGYAAAKWGTESSVTLAKASAERTKANRADLEGIVTRTLDSASFNAWFTAFTAGNANAERLAARRMRPGYRPAFNAWLATDPAHNPNAPPGPAYMPQYVIPQDAAGKSYDAHADADFAKGAHAGWTADKYIRDTVFLATVLFLVGISGHFRIRAARFGLIGIGVALLVFAATQLLGLPGPPS